MNQNTPKEAYVTACKAVSTALDMLDTDGQYTDIGEVYHMLASVLRNPEILL